MKRSELPKEYRDLEKKFNSECEVSKEFDNIKDRFWWKTTPQGHDFWGKCARAKTIADLPKITITDYPENIKEPEKKERYFIVFYSKDDVSGNIRVITNGNYIVNKHIKKELNANDGRFAITNIIELNESDYNDFIA